MIQLKIHQSQPNIYALFWRFDLITRSSSEEAGTQFFQVLMRRSAVASRKIRQLIVASRLGRTEYQLLLMQISWWDRNVKIRYKCLVVIYEFLTALTTSISEITLRLFTFFYHLSTMNWSPFICPHVTVHMQLHVVHGPVCAVMNSYPGFT